MNPAFACLDAEGSVVVADGGATGLGGSGAGRGCGDPLRGGGRVEGRSGKGGGVLPPVRGVHGRGGLSSMHGHLQQQHKAHLPEGAVATLAGAEGGFRDEASRGRSYRTRGMCVDPEGNVVVASWGNHCIRKMDLKRRVVCTIAGREPGWVDGPAPDARFSNPTAVGYDRHGDL